MEEKTHSDITVNIYGGTVQILPNATNAEQHIYAASPTESSSPINNVDETLSDAAVRLKLYINKVEDFQGYLNMLAACSTAKQIAEVVAVMSDRESRLTSEEICRAKFIELLPPLAPKVTKGITIDNLRIHIYNAVNARKKIARTLGKGPIQSILR